MTQNPEGSTDLTKVIKDKSRDEVSLLEQDTIKNVSNALSIYLVTLTLISNLGTDYIQKT